MELNELMLGVLTLAVLALAGVVGWLCQNTRTRTGPSPAPRRPVPEQQTRVNSYGELEE